MKRDYPLPCQLKKLARLAEQNKPMETVEYMRGLWWADTWGFHVNQKPGGVQLDLSTGGWSGNEDIIGVLQKSFFWLAHWKQSSRGGHYIFFIEGAK